MKYILGYAILGVVDDSIRNPSYPKLEMFEEGEEVIVFQVPSSLIVCVLKLNIDENTDGDYVNIPLYAMYEPYVLSPESDFLTNQGIRATGLISGRKIKDYVKSEFVMDVIRDTFDQMSLE